MNVATRINCKNKLSTLTISVSTLSVLLSDAICAPILKLNPIYYIFIQIVIFLVILSPISFFLIQRQETAPAEEAIPSTPTPAAALPDAPPPSPPPAGPVMSEQVFALSVSVAEILSSFRGFSEELRTEVAGVVRNTGDNDVRLMSQLCMVQTGMERVLNFTANSRQTFLGTIAAANEQVAGSRALIGEFSDNRARDAIRVQTASEDIGRLVQDLGQIVEIVRSLSHRTRMLALNATIEAARAGEMGRGFAVVASEVKDLSQRSDQAAVQIGDGIAKLEAAVTSSLRSIIFDRNSKEEQGFAAISAAVNGLADNLRDLIAYEETSLLKVTEENERLAEPIRGMMNGINFQDSVKDHLGSLVEDFEGIIAAIDQSVAEMSAHPQMSIEDVNTAIRNRLDAVLQTCRSRLADKRRQQQQAEADKAPTGDETEIELF
ncbi:methyl-accepting chemotaxis protein PctA [mine drainage metagenome]|uniref:Methyl-accepting chemotaxis protein PctA n=1 Tax=mine drainage metagenome TaxID=410659 RepID=A0A1J5RW22_9ZZZZ